MVKKVPVPFDPRPSKAHPEHRAHRLKVEKETPAFSSKEAFIKVGLMALMGIMAFLPVEKQAQEAKKEHEEAKRQHEERTRREHEETRRDRRRERHGHRRSSVDDGDLRRSSYAGSSSGSTARSDRTRSLGHWRPDQLYEARRDLRPLEGAYEYVPSERGARRERRERDFDGLRTIKEGSRSGRSEA